MPPIKLKFFYFSVLIALVLQMLPWTSAMVLLRPDFVLLVIIYWLLRAPKLCNVGTAWFAGLLIDLISGSVFGQNALAYALTAFFAVVYQRRLILFTVWQQSAYVLALLILNQTSLFVLKLLSGGEFPGWVYFAPCVSGIIIWHLAAYSSFGIHAHSSKS